MTKPCVKWKYNTSKFVFPVWVTILILYIFCTNFKFNLCNRIHVFILLFRCILKIKILYIFEFLTNNYILCFKICAKILLAPNKPYNGQSNTPYSKAELKKQTNKPIWIQLKFNFIDAPLLQARSLSRKIKETYNTANHKYNITFFISVTFPNSINTQTNWNKC